MNWLNRINQAIDYLESNLAADIDYEMVAKIACCSTYHFQRMFSYITGVSISEYVRRRRMTLAALELNQSDIKILDVAMKYGYASADAFSRAFKALHGISPQQAKTKGSMLKAFPKMTLSISVKGNKELRYRIEEKSAFTVFGLETILHMDGRSITEGPNFWKEFYRKGLNHELYRGPGGHYHAVMDYEYVGENKMIYMICSVKEDGIDTTGFKEVFIPKATWAIFPTEVVPKSELAGPIQQASIRAFTEWLPSSEYEYAKLPYCEFYYDTEGGCYGEMWIPIVKANKTSV